MIRLADSDGQDWRAIEPDACAGSANGVAPPLWITVWETGSRGAYAARKIKDLLASSHDGGIVSR
ncbi:MAG: hypothetical protein WAS23_00260 [Dokdonella sp.]